MVGERITHVGNQCVTGKEQQAVVELCSSSPIVWLTVKRKKSGALNQHYIFILLAFTDLFAFTNLHELFIQICFFTSANQSYKTYIFL